ncbi:acyl-CoA reductase [Psychroflexus sediminis]|uniref:Acyl-CoA reductase (LuxC) n=1 Tax=Psychroflexus sediminis TaxID=470826 RepID=A0A1G7XPQ8_9FLAO|nr:acyl-CoA reductase [Psychroflexus sediminis]SDG86184.1 Acyl-CoA reductase (LuxC) [Psychroflexus sediminis]
MTLDTRIEAFSELGFSLQNYIESKNSSSNFSQKLTNILRSAELQNAWFTQDQIHSSLKDWAQALTKSNLNNWLDPYVFENLSKKRVAVVMAGNIPLVGFHDFLSVLITGHTFIGKLSSNDSLLVPFLAEELIAIEPGFKSKIEFTKEKLPEFDAVIATGSNNTARYFEYYFKDKPHIIRKNRNSAAILDGTESKEDLEALGDDVFKYFGLGCRNVSKLFVPEAYDFDKFFKAMFRYKDVINHHKYANNYDYNKAVYLMSSVKLLDNGFLLLKEDLQFSSPIGTLFYETFSDESHLKQRLEEEKKNIQCIVGAHKYGEVDFGKAQHPKLSDYADGVDTLEFLIQTN